MKLKLDLHTHCFEATGQRWVDVNVVERLINQIKARGLDGIAVTEHHDKRYGMQAKEIAEQYFDSVLIIPGREVDEGINQVVELFLPNGSMFRFVAHPRYLGSLKIDGRVQGIEVKNALHNGEINEEKVREAVNAVGTLANDVRAYLVPRVFRTNKPFPAKPATPNR